MSHARHDTYGAPGSGASVDAVSDRGLALGEAAAALIQASPVPTAVVDRELRCVAANDALARRLGMPVAVIIGRDVRDTMSAAHWARVADLHARGLAGERITGEVVAADPDDPDGLVISFHLTPIRGQDGAVRGLACAYSEEPMRRRADEQLHALADLREMLTRAAQAAAVCGSREELFQKVCDFAVGIGGFSAAWVGVPAGDMLELAASAGDRAGFLAGLQISTDPDDPRSHGPTGIAARTGSAQVVNDFLARFPNPVFHRDAAARCPRSAAAFPFHERGRVIATLSVYADRSNVFTPMILGALEEIMPIVSLALERQAEADDRRRDEEARQLLEEQLRHAAKMEAIGMLAGSVAHDFNNALTVIRNVCRLLLDEGLSIENRARAETIDLAAESAAALTAQLLTFARRQLIRPDRLELDELVRESAPLVERLVGASVRVELALGAAGASILIDRGEFQQALLNLAANARDAMPAGGVLRLRTAVANDESAGPDDGRTPVAATADVVLEVQDTGEGMDASTLSRIFEPFFTTKSLGTGLGLATVHAIAERAGGALEAESTPSRGTTMRLRLPQREDDAQDSRPPATASVTAEAGRGETVLVVEDSDMLRPIVGQMLSRAGYSVVAAADGVEALHVVTEHGRRVDLVLTDVVMPRMDGGELVERLARLQPGIAVLFTSGYPADTVARHGIEEARVAFVQKPYVAEDLLRQVRAAIDTAAPRA